MDKKLLASHFQSIQNTTLRTLLGNATVETAGIHFNYTHHPITKETIDVLTSQATLHGLGDYIQNLTQGKKVNVTENRAAWHTALRDPKTPVDDVQATLDKMASLCDTLHQQDAITDVVHLGVGGSFWGPQFVVEALHDLPKKLNVHFVAELDEAQLRDTLLPLKPENTLFIVASKSFTTPETLANANRAKAWGAKHFIAITANVENARTWGIQPEYIFPMWDWVGGRFSVWSAVGLPIALAYGMDVFLALLRGAHRMDQHFISQPFLQNMPVLMALLSYAYIQFYNAPTRAVLPYAHRLRGVVPYVQQLCMESLGKRCDTEGNSVDYATGSIIWGATGTHAQHTFNQLIHQGTHVIPVDFILIDDESDNAAALRAQCMAQSHTLCYGDPSNEQPHRRIGGNQPHSIITLNGLTPETIGALLALYEHQVASLGCLLNINPFDQFGVEHSKAFLKKGF